MTNWTAASLPDLTGRTVVITGATSGIGLVAAREFARVGARVVLAVRNVAKGEDAARAIPGRVEVRELDVASLASIRAFASAWTGDLDILINNAGIMEVPFARTEDGFESQMATNYFGPFALTNLLLPHITGRVVSVSSQLHRMGKLHLEDLNGEHYDYSPAGAYNDSKLAITLFSLELQRRLTEAGSAVRSMIAHPGIASTNLGQGTTSARVTNALRFLFNDSEHGALPTLFAATADIPGDSYVGPNGPGSMKGYPVVRSASKAARDADSARALWSATENLTGITASVPR
jgi:NAD(P)-dependent dehydrogenase (short-subunit alcohol dehydrogenase family)